MIGGLGGIRFRILSFVSSLKILSYSLTNFKWVSRILDFKFRINLAVQVVEQVTWSHFKYEQDCDFDHWGVCWYSAHQR
jgi:hypothetical protein